MKDKQLELCKSLQNHIQIQKKMLNDFIVVDVKIQKGSLKRPVTLDEMKKREKNSKIGN